jgi:hypothetical protein
MAWIGKEPLNAYNAPDKDSFDGDGSTVAFTLSKPVALASDLEVFVGNVQQEPTTAYTVSNKTLTFTGTPATGSNNIYAVHRSGGMQTLTAPSGADGDFADLTASGDATVTGDLTVTGNIIGDIEITGTTPKLTIGDADAEDSTLQFDGNAQDYYIALDDSADDLLIGLGSTVGTTPAISIDENLQVKTYGDIVMTGTTPTLTIGDAGAEDAAIVFDGNAKDFYIALDDSADKIVIGEGSTVGTNSILTITDDTLTIGDAAAVDTKIVFDGNAQDYYIALDDSADDLLIGLGSTVGTTPAISIDENLQVKTYGDIVMTGTTPTLTIGDAGAEDAAIVFDGNAQDFYIALDDSADDLLIGLGSTVGTTPAISIDENQLVTTHAGITMAGGTPTLTIGDAGAEDTKIVFDGNAQDFYIGLDDSADDLLIGLGSAVGTTPAISIAETLKTTFGGGAVGATLTDATNTGDITLDFDTYSNFVLTFTGNVVLVNPTTESIGQTGIIVVIQDGTGSRTISGGTQYEWPGGAIGTISTAANSIDVIPYIVDAADSILLGAPALAFSTP